MSSFTTLQSIFQLHLLMLPLFIHFSIIPACNGASVTKKLDQLQLVPQEPDTGGIKCESCPCNPCDQLSPPPPPAPPADTCCPSLPLTPPPPRFVYVTNLPPPPPRFVCVPDNLCENNPYDWEFYNGAGLNAATWLWLWTGAGVLHLMGIW